MTLWWVGGVLCFLSMHTAGLVWGSNMRTRMCVCCCRYRTREEMGAWGARDPVVRFRNWLVRNSWWDEGREQEVRQQTRQQVGAGVLQDAGMPAQAALSSAQGSFCGSAGILVFSSDPYSAVPAAACC